MESPSTDMKKRGSWDLLTEMAADMVNNLELGDGDFGSGLIYPPKNTKRNSLNSLPAINHSSSTPIRRRASETIMNLFSGDDDLNFDHDPSMSDLKTQAKQQQQQQHRGNSVFSSFALPTRKPKAKKDPLMEFHERYNKAQGEFNKQQEKKNKEEAKMRRQQFLDHDEEKSLSSSNSLFDFITKSGAADELLDDQTTDGRSLGAGDAVSGGMKRRGSTNSMASFFGMFGDDAAEISKLSSAKPAGITAEKPSLETAVNQSKSVKGHRLFIRGEKAAGEGDWKKAVAYYHIALVKQRKYYGEDHIVTSKTLNALGLALMNIGEHFGALTALEEALHIRQEKLGAGSEEAAETTSNVCLVLKASQDDTQ